MHKFIINIKLQVYTSYYSFQKYTEQYAKISNLFHHTPVGHFLSPVGLSFAQKPVG